MSSQVEQIKDRLDIVDVVGSYIKLDKAGKNLKAPCPFHNEKTPSFFVSPDRNTYHCFGCNRGGDIFSFVEEFEGLDFRGALKVLADRAGVALTPVDPAVADERDRLLRAHSDAAVFFTTQLRAHSDAESYLTDRQIDTKIIEQFTLGYVPDGWRHLHDHLTSLGYSQTELLTAGLIKQAENGRVYDTFRSRIMFPIGDASGRVVGFSGRIFGDEADNPKVAKYLNSPETPLFNKSQTLYAYADAKMEMRKLDFAIIVEGQIDVLMSHQAGYRNTVAPLGTALTDKHLDIITRLTNNIVLALDGDKAGIASAERSAELALSRGCDVKVATLPTGSDPADLIAEDPKLWKEAIRTSEHIIDFLLGKIQETTDDQRKYAQRVSAQVLPYVARISSSIDQEHFINRIAERLNVTQDAIRADMAAIADHADAPRVATPEQAAPPSVSQINKLHGIILWQQELEKPTIDVTAALARLQALAPNGEPLNTLTVALKNDLIFEAEMMFTDSDKLVQHVEELFITLELEQLTAALSKLMTQLKQAEQDKDPVRALEILKQCKEVSQTIEDKKQHTSTT